MVTNSDMIIKMNGLELPNYVELDDWKNLMKEDGCYCDQLFIQLASEILNRKFILVPVHKECGIWDTGRIEVEPTWKQPIGAPLNFLYYTESK